MQKFSVNTLGVTRFNQIETNKILFRPDITYLRWGKKTDSIRLNTNGANFYMPLLKNTQSIIGANPIVIGKDIMTWYYDVLVPGPLAIGLATDIVTPIFSFDIDATEGDRIYHNLSSTKIIIKHMTGDNLKLLAKKEFVLIPFTGQIIYTWCSISPNKSMSLKIMDDNMSFLSVINGKLQITNYDGENKASCIDIIDNKQYSFNLTYDMYMINVTSPKTLVLNLPPIREISEGPHEYIIIRNFPQLPNETWDDPFLKIYAESPETIENSPFIGIWVNSKLQLISNNITKKWEMVG
jgi:hypothetical protein